MPTKQTHIFCCLTATWGRVAESDRTAGSTILGAQMGQMRVRSTPRHVQTRKQADRLIARFHFNALKKSRDQARLQETSESTL